MSDSLKERLDEKNLAKLMALKNTKLHAFVADAIELCQPDEVRVLDDSAASMALTRKTAVEGSEETPLAIAGHTLHFDGPSDQGRDRKVTKYLVPKEDSLSEALNQTEREGGLAEVRGLLQGSMQGRRA